MVSERYMRPLVDRLITEIYGEPDIIAEEVPTPTKCYIDVLYLYNNEPYVVAVELKISDWETGLWQAIRRKHYAKYSYLALQWKRHRNVDLNRFRKWGVGLIAVNEVSARVLVEPEESEFFEKRRLKILNYIVTALRKAEKVEVRRVPDWIRYPPQFFV